VVPVTRAAKTPLTSYQKRLFIFLSVATFFEGYDLLALTQILPNLRDDMGLSRADAGWLVAVVNIGTVLAYLLVRKADGWGRRRVLTITIAGYTLFTFATGLSWDVYSFAAFQLVARVFLIAEWATAMVYAAEEFPADRRGMVIGVVSGFASLGAIVCAGVVPVLLSLDVANPITGDPLGWRSVYFVGILPLILVAYARRNLRETARFEETRERDRGRARPLTAILRSGYRGRMLKLSLIWGVTYVCSQNAVTFWKDFAANERGLTDGQVGLAIMIAGAVSMPLIFLVGPLIDRFGRKPGAAVVFGLAAVGVFFSYTLHGQWALTAPLILAIFGAAAVMPVLNAFTTELFPTELRADAFAWANNLLGRISYVLSPIVVAQLAEVYQWGPVLRLTAIAPVLAFALIAWTLPETRNRELEDTAAL
jgi:MFS transporter, putative metabolite:H+ symporter